MLLPSSPLLLKLLLSGAWTWCRSIDVYIWGESLNTLLTRGVLQRLTPVAGDLLCKWILKHSSQYRSGNKRHINMFLVNNVLTSLGLSYLLYKMGAVVVPPSCWGRLRETNALKVLCSPCRTVSTGLCSRRHGCKGVFVVQERWICQMLFLHPLRWSVFHFIVFVPCYTDQLLYIEPSLHSRNKS